MPQNVHPVFSRQNWMEKTDDPMEKSQIGFWRDFDLPSFCFFLPKVNQAPSFHIWYLCSAVTPEPVTPELLSCGPFYPLMTGLREEAWDENHPHLRIKQRECVSAFPSLFRAEKQPPIFFRPESYYLQVIDLPLTLL